MLRPAVPADLPLLLAIRDGSGTDALSDPALVTETGLARWIAAGAVTVWGADGVLGFTATDGPALHLLVNSAARGKGIGRELLAAACAALKRAGHAEAVLCLAAGGTAARHYRTAGWNETERTPVGGMVLKKPF